MKTKTDIFYSKSNQIKKSAFKINRIMENITKGLRELKRQFRSEE